MQRLPPILFLTLLAAISALTQRSNAPFNGLDMNLGNLSRLSNARARSISPENFTGEKGKGGTDDLTDTRPNHANAKNEARELGQRWKLNPFIKVKPGETFTIAPRLV